MPCLVASVYAALITFHFFFFFLGGCVSLTVYSNRAPTFICFTCCALGGKVVPVVHGTCWTLCQQEHLELHPRVQLVCVYSQLCAPAKQGLCAGALLEGILILRAVIRIKET